MKNGMQCDFKPLLEDRQIADMELVTNRGNYKLAINKLHLLESLVGDNIKAGFQVPLPIYVVLK